MPLLDVKSLITELRVGETHCAVVDGISFQVEPHETLAVVGESGCGKSMMALSLMRILPQPIARIASGEIVFDGIDLAKASERDMRRIRGKKMSMVFQDPMASLNPVQTVGDQIIEVIREHEPLSRAAARRRALELLHLVRLSDPERRFDDYPHRLSGGMCQRVMIAIALAGRPQLLIADEPTTALDVTIQAQILALLKAIQAATGTAIILITHSLAVVMNHADRVIVMYAGTIVEQGPVAEIFGHAVHPYTAGLMGAIPSMTRPLTDDIEPLNEIPGVVPPPELRPAGCPFEPRCNRAIEHCRTERPLLTDFGNMHSAACYVPIEGPRR